MVADNARTLWSFGNSEGIMEFPKSRGWGGGVKIFMPPVVG